MWHSLFGLNQDKWLRQFKASPGRISETGLCLLVYALKTAFKCYFLFVMTTAEHAEFCIAVSAQWTSTLSETGDINQTATLFQMIPQMHWGTDVYFSGVPANRLHEAPQLTWQQDLTSPVGSRPLSCGPGQCWCWSPKIHRDRFHPPEMEKWREKYCYIFICNNIVTNNIFIW